MRTSRELSTLAAWFRLLYVAIAGAAVLHLLLAARLVDGTGYTAAFEQGQREAQVMLSLDGFLYGDFNRNVAVLLLAVVTVPGEFGLTGWLLWRAGRHGSPVQPGLAEHPV